MYLHLCLEVAIVNIVSALYVSTSIFRSSYCGHCQNIIYISTFMNAIAGLTHMSLLIDYAMSGAN